MPNITLSFLARALIPFVLVYLHVIERRIKISLSDDDKPPVAAGWLGGLFQGPAIPAGGFAIGAKAILKEGDADLVRFGRLFLANPDLLESLRLNPPLNPYDGSTFYLEWEKWCADNFIHREVET